MALAFVDLEKAFDTVPRKMAMATLRWMGAPASEVKMVEAMYENTKARVVVGSGMSNEFQVNIGLRQGSALSPLLYILVMELINRKISTTDALRKICVYLGGNISENGRVDVEVRRRIQAGANA